MNDSAVMLSRVTCGSCGRKPKAKSVRTYGMVTRAKRGVEGVHIPGIWRWQCPFGKGDWQVPCRDLEQATARGRVTLGVDLG